MLKRTITGLALFGFALLIIFLSSISPLFFDMTVLLVTAVAVFEVYKAFSKGGYHAPMIPLIIVVAAIYPMCYFFGVIGLLFTVFTGVLTAFVIFIFDHNKSLKDFTAAVFMIIYPFSIMSCMFILSKGYGLIPILLALGAALMSDNFAYFGGSLLGKKKIFPKISPKKTYAGSISGLFGGTAGGLLVWALFEVAKFPFHRIFTFSAEFSMPYIIYMVLGFVLAIVSELGDLAASRIKREVGIKDYGTIFASHGGVMDRIDSILFVTPVVTAIMLIFF